MTESQTAVDLRTYNRAYYFKNREAISVRKKARYQNDTAYRDRMRRNAEDRYKKQRAALLGEFGGNLPPRLPRGFNRPRVALLDGQEAMVHGVGVFAAELGCTVQTVTNWEKRRIIPPPPLKDERNRRWYSVRHIESVKRAVTEWRNSGTRSNVALRERVWGAWKRPSPENGPQKEVGRG